MSITMDQVVFCYNPKDHPEKQALKQISVSFEDHCFTALIGKTGSGKSTLIQHLNGLLVPTTGVIETNGFTIDMKAEYKKNGKLDERAMKKKHKKKIADIKNLRKKVGIVFQFPEYQIFEETVLKDVSYGPKNFGASEEEALEKAKHALTLVGLDESFYERSPFELSGGEKRRVAIAGILALEPAFLVLDEPTVGLDAAGEANLMALITSLYEKGTSIILATHNMDVVLGYCKKAIVLEKGRIVKDATPCDLFQDEEFLKTSSLEPPLVFRFALSLMEKGMKLDIHNVRDCASLAKEIKRCKEGGRK